MQFQLKKKKNNYELFSEFDIINKPVSARIRETEDSSYEVSRIRINLECAHLALHLKCTDFKTHSISCTIKREKVL